MWGVRGGGPAPAGLGGYELHPRAPRRGKPFSIPSLEGLCCVAHGRLLYSPYIGLNPAKNSCVMGFAKWGGFFFSSSFLCSVNSSRRGLRAPVFFPSRAPGRRHPHRCSRHASRLGFCFVLDRCTPRPGQTGVSQHPPRERCGHQKSCDCTGRCHNKAFWARVWFASDRSIEQKGALFQSRMMETGIDHAHDWPRIWLGSAVILAQGGCEWLQGMKKRLRSCRVELRDVVVLGGVAGQLLCTPYTRRVALMPLLGVFVGPQLRLVAGHCRQAVDDSVHLV